MSRELTGSIFAASLLFTAGCTERSISFPETTSPPAVAPEIIPTTPSLHSTSPIIPSSVVETAPTTLPPTPTTILENVAPNCIVEVKPGDTLINIADDANVSGSEVSVADLKTHNNIIDENKINAGQLLDICINDTNDITGEPFVAVTTTTTTTTLPPTVPPLSEAPPTTIPPASETTVPLAEGIDNIPGCTFEDLTDDCRAAAYELLRIAGYANADQRFRVRAYQAFNTDIHGQPLEVDSQLGPLTFGAIDSDPDIMSESHANDGRIDNGAIVNLDTQTEWVFNDGVLVGVYAVTTGIDDRWVEFTDPVSGETKLVDARTEVGSFVVQREVDGWKTSSAFQQPTDDPVMYESAYYKGGEANHGVPEGLVSLTGEKKSKGCVRIPAQDMDADANGVSLDAMIEPGDAFIIEGTRPELPPKP